MPYARACNDHARKVAARLGTSPEGEARCESKTSLSFLVEKRETRVQQRREAALPVRSDLISPPQRSDRGLANQRAR